MYDLIYLANREDYHKAQAELEQVFPDAHFEDASDFIHHDRFSIEADVSDEDYRLQILDLGLAFCSFNFQVWMLQEPKQVKTLIDKWKETNPAPEPAGAGDVLPTSSQERNNEEELQANHL